MTIDQIILSLVSAADAVQYGVAVMGLVVGVCWIGAAVKAIKGGLQ